MNVLPTCVAGHGSHAMKHVLSQFRSVLTGHTEIVWNFFTDKYAFQEKNNFVLASQGLGADRKKSHFFQKFFTTG